MLLCAPQKKNQSPKGNKFLVSVTVLGSAGPIRFVVSEEDLVAAVIDTVLKSYAREGRLPVLGSSFKDFYLYCPVSRPDAINPWDTIGSVGTRDFILCKKPEEQKTEDGNRRSVDGIAAAKKKARKWKSWINRSLSSKISSH